MCPWVFWNLPPIPWIDKRNRCAIAAPHLTDKPRKSSIDSMTQPPTPPAPTAPVKATSQASIYADRANALMRQLSVLPTPKNFSIFFACAAGQPTEMVREIEAARGRNMPITEEFLDMLYVNYIAEAQARTVQESALNARKIIADALQNITTFTSDTTAISKEVTQKLKEFESQSSDEAVRVFATTLVQSATAMQNTGDSVTKRLAGAQQEILELRETLARVVTEAERDFLTGSYNRKAFDKRLADAIDEARSSDTELTLLMLDIDHFKKFNDNFGHIIGDEVLKIVAKSLADTLKGSDTVARYGGEEFAVILPRTPLTGGMFVGEAIRSSIAGRELKSKVTGENFGIITVSVGVATLKLHQEDSALGLIKRADKALYDSKHNGRNRVSSEG